MRKPPQDVKIYNSNFGVFVKVTVLAEAEKHEQIRNSVMFPLKKFKKQRKVAPKEETTKSTASKRNEAKTNMANEGCIQTQV